MSERRRVAVKVVETIHYYRTVDLEVIEDAAAVSLDEVDGDLNTLVELAQERASTSFAPAMRLATELERHGDVQGQTWSATWEDQEE